MVDVSELVRTMKGMFKNSVRVAYGLWFWCPETPEIARYTCAEHALGIASEKEAKRLTGHNPGIADSNDPD